MINARRSALALGTFRAPALATRAARPRVELRGAIYAGAIVLSAAIGVVAGLSAPMPAPLYAFNVAHGTEWHTVDYNLTRADCLALLSALPADAPSAECNPAN